MLLMHLCVVSVWDLNGFGITEYYGVITEDRLRSELHHESIQAASHTTPPPHHPHPIPRPRDAKSRKA